MPQRARVGRVDRRSSLLAEITGYLSLQTSRLASTCQLHGSGGSRDPTARRTTMFDTASASNGVKLALLEGQLLTREIDRATFIERATNLGLPAPAIGDAADKFMAIAANQAARRATLRANYDYMVIGSGASGSVVARRLAENQNAQVLLLEAGGEDLKPGILITETWFFNQGGEFDWNFSAERSPSVNNRSIVQAMGKVIGGGTSIKAMVCARDHKNDFDHFERRSHAHLSLRGSRQRAPRSRRGIDHRISRAPSLKI